MTKFTKRDVEGYQRVLKALEEGKAYGEVMTEGTTEVYNGLSITVGTSTTTTTYDMDAICKKFPSVTKEKFGKTSPRKASVKVSIITK